MHAHMLTRIPKIMICYCLLLDTIVSFENDAWKLLHSMQTKYGLLFHKVKSNSQPRASLRYVLALQLCIHSTLFQQQTYNTASASLESRWTHSMKYPLKIGSSSMLLGAVLGELALLASCQELQSSFLRLRTPWKSRTKQNGPKQY